MNRTRFFALALAMAIGSPVAAQQEDLLSVFLAQDGMAERLGLEKLTQAERDAWNEILNVVFRAGVEMPAPTVQGGSGAGVRGGVEVFEATVDEAEGDVVQLSNGAVVEVTGFLGYVGFRRSGLLIREGRSWRLWIEGKRTYTAQVLRTPRREGRSGETVMVAEILGNGTLLRLGDGRLLEVDAVDRIFTGIWLPFFDAVLVDGYELWNLDSGEKVLVRPVG